jgi:hypothetical protein
LSHLVAGIDVSRQTATVVGHSRICS